MKSEVFYAIGSTAALLAIGAESVHAHRKGKRWYEGADTIANLNLAAGNLLLGAVLTGVVVMGYEGLRSIAVFDVSAKLPGWTAVAVAIVFADFLQYWNHRLSHRANVLWWGHITHHSSTEMNLSTGIRINWLYRSYAWFLYAPMPLLGFTFEEFVASQAAINVYNLFMHTRLNVPFGPLEKVLVTPASHRLHHSADPRYFGNYGAALIVWDRLFGTYRELPATSTEGATSVEPDLAFGIGRDLGRVDPLSLNFHYLRELWTTARTERRSFVLLLFSSAPSALPAPARGTRTKAKVSLGVWLGLLCVALLAVAVNQGHARLSRGTEALAVVTGVALVIAFGVLLDARLTRQKS